MVPFVRIALTTAKFSPSQFDILENITNLVPRYRGKTTNILSGKNVTDYSRKNALNNIPIQLPRISVSSNSVRISNSTVFSYNSIAKEKISKK